MTNFVSGVDLSHCRFHWDVSRCMYVAPATMFLTMLQHHQRNLLDSDEHLQSGGTTLGIAKQERSQKLFFKIKNFADAFSMDGVMATFPTIDAKNVDQTG
ncbi:hypothetical protein KCU87_g543, partial [Aureobasidium melanogenum]